MVWNISQFLGNLIYRIRVVCLGDSIFDNDFPEEFEDDITVSENAFTYKKSLLFGNIMSKYIYIVNLKLRISRTPLKLNMLILATSLAK